MSVFTCSIGFYNVEIELNIGDVLTFSILYTPVTIHVVDELGSLEILDIDPLITSSVGFMGFIEYALCIGLAAILIIIIREETTTINSIDINNFCLNNFCLYI